MTPEIFESLDSLPAVDRVLAWPPVMSLADEFGRTLTLEAVRSTLQALRDDLGAGGKGLDSDAICHEIADHVHAVTAPSLRPVFNLTGTVLHTNLGRAPLPEEAIDAMNRVARGASNLEYDLERGRRGQRGVHIERWVRRLTGAEDAVAVNNNAAAVLLMLNTLARGKEVVVSRGELIEIGGAFRIPDIMSRAGARLVEVGTTNRTHLRDYEDAVGDRTALLMKVHTSNYVIEGFTAAVPERDLAALGERVGQPMVSDLGSGSLVDMREFGLPHEPTVRDTIDAGAALVTFSGDKLLGGPQAGIIAGRADLVARIKRNPMMRALRLDKVTIAALEAVLALYCQPEKLRDRVPALRLLGRPEPEIRAQAERIAPVVAARLGAKWTVDVAACKSQIGSGALPVDRLPSAALRVRPAAEGRGGSGRLNRLAKALRGLALPVIGRVNDGALVLDLRCLDDEPAFIDQIARLDPP